MNPKVIKSQNFDIALAWVKQKYPFLFHEGIERIELVRSNGKWLGLHTFSGGRSHIRIATGRWTSSDFVSTLVHELVHALQYRSNMDILPEARTKLEVSKADIEKQAEDLSTEAYIVFKKENNIPIWL